MDKERFCSRQPAHTERKVRRKIDRQIDVQFKPKKDYISRALVGGVLAIAAVATSSTMCKKEEHRAAQEVEKWQRDMNLILNDPMTPSTKEWSEKVEVVAAQEGTRVNVRTYPEMHHGNLRENEELGQVDQGTEIENGVMITVQPSDSRNPQKWIITFCQNIKGLIFKNGRSVTPKENQVCAIRAEYVERVVKPKETPKVKLMPTLAPQTPIDKPVK